MVIRYAMALVIGGLLVWAWLANAFIGAVLTPAGLMSMWVAVRGPALKERREAMGDLDDQARRNVSKWFWTQGPQGPR